MSERRGEWIMTFTGKKFYLHDPRPEDICIEDVAHHLANLCRFTGAVPVFYSVAQHSVLCSQHVEVGLELWALLHDAGEAFIGDFSRQLKKALPPIRSIETKIMQAVARRFSLPDLGDGRYAEVKRADDLLLATEGRDFFAAQEHGWHHVPANGYQVLSERIVPVGPAEAEALFLERFEELTGGVR